MDGNEVQLERVAAKAESFEVPQTLPMFELMAAMMSMGMAMILFVIPAYLENNYALHSFTVFMMPQWAWASIFLVAGITSAVGLLTRRKRLRQVGLYLMALVFALLSFFYLMEVPTGSVGGMMFGLMAIFAIASTFLVKYTGLGTKTMDGSASNYKRMGEDKNDSR